MPMAPLLLMLHHPQLLSCSLWSFATPAVLPLLLLLLLMPLPPPLLLWLLLMPLPPPLPPPLLLWLLLMRSYLCVCHFNCRCRTVLGCCPLPSAAAPAAARCCCSRCFWLIALITQLLAVAAAALTCDKHTPRPLLCMCSWSDTWTSPGHMQGPFKGKAGCCGYRCSGWVILSVIIRGPNQPHARARATARPP
jgi:hypothetical protein